MPVAAQVPGTGVSCVGWSFTAASSLASGVRGRPNVVFRSTDRFDDVGVMPGLSNMGRWFNSGLLDPIGRSAFDHRLHKIPTSAKTTPSALRAAQRHVITWTYRFTPSHVT